MESQNKGTIINACWGRGYFKGSNRLERSLIYHGWIHDINIWRDQLINEWFQPQFVYTIKAAALVEAYQMGYTHVLWADSSFWCVQNPSKIMDVVNEEGGYFCRSGYNLAQTATDSDLEFAGWSRDYAENLNELASGMFGINFLHPKGKKFYNVFLAAAKAGVFNSPREHNNGSMDPRFLFGRQDQVAATIAYYKAGFDNVRCFGDLAAYYEPHKELNPSVLFTIQGL
jgi:hypothetical protein